MTTSNTQSNQGHDRPPHGNEDTDWIVVKAGADTGKDDFEMIDAADAQCWCGGSDSELCRQKGHRWPLCRVDQGELLPKESDESSHRSNDKEEKDEGGHYKSDGDHFPGETFTCEPDRRPKKKRRIDIPPTSHNTSSRPFSQLAVLTDLLDPTRMDDEDLYSAYRK